MVALSVFLPATRPGEHRRVEMDHLEVMKQAVDTDSISLVIYAARHTEKPVLTGLRDGPAVVKRVEAGDDGQSFEALYDTAITVNEYKAMSEHGVDDPKDLPLPLWRVFMALAQVPILELHLKATGPNDVRNRLKRLAKDEKFKAALFTRMMIGWTTMGRLSDHDKPEIEVGDISRLEIMSASDDPEWKFIPGLGEPEIGDDDE